MCPANIAAGLHLFLDVIDDCQGDGISRRRIYGDFPPDQGLELVLAVVTDYDALFSSEDYITAPNCRAILSFNVTDELINEHNFNCIVAVL